MKKMPDYIKERNYLLDKYKNCIFTDDYIDRWKDELDGMKLVLFRKLENFDIFINKYNTDGIRIINGKDSYKEAKIIYNKIMNGELFVDKELSEPDNTLRNIILLLHIDKYKAEQNTIK